MANPSVTYTFSNSTTADGTQVTQNFTDVINSLTDGTKDLTISALTCGGTATLNGSVLLGNGTPDDISVLGSLATSIPIKTTNTYDIGSATLGLRKVYLGASDSSSRSVGLYAQAVTSSYSLGLPVAVPTAANQVMTFDTSASGSFEPKSKRATTSKTTTYTATSADDVIFVSAAASWTLSLPAAASNTGKVFNIIRTDNALANQVTIDPNGSETINGLTTVKLYTQYESWEIVSDGTNWQVIEHRTHSPWTSDASAVTIQGFGTIASATFFRCRRGDSLWIKGNFTAGTVAASTASITIGNSLTIDSAKMSAATNATKVGEVTWSPGSAAAIGANNAGGHVFYDGSDTAKVYMAYQVNTGYTKVNGNVVGTSSQMVTFELEVPISGWDF